MGRRKRQPPTTKRAVPVSRTEIQDHVTRLAGELTAIQNVEAAMAQRNLDHVTFDGSGYVDRGISNVRSFRVRLQAAVEECS